MLLPRVIPCLLTKNKQLVKGVNFRNHTYVGDPMNAIQIFNTKEVDEIILLDITATEENRIPPIDLIERIADYSLTPFAVGGGIKSVDDAHAILRAGAEKVCINSAAMDNPGLVSDIAAKFGAQAVSVSIDVKSNFWGKLEAYKFNGSKKVPSSPIDLAKKMVESGAGEIILNSIDRDGTGKGYDLDILREFVQELSVPVVALGGAGHLDHLKECFENTQASAAAAGSLFVFHGKRRAVLISYPTIEELASIRGES